MPDSTDQLPEPMLNFRDIIGNISPCTFNWKYLNSDNEYIWHLRIWIFSQGTNALKCPKLFIYVYHSDTRKHNHCAPLVTSTGASICICHVFLWQYDFIFTSPLMTQVKDVSGAYYNSVDDILSLPLHIVFLCFRKYLYVGWQDTIVAVLYSLVLQPQLNMCIYAWPFNYGDTYISLFYCLISVCFICIVLNKTRVIDYWPGTHSTKGLWAHNPNFVKSHPFS